MKSTFQSHRYKSTTHKVKSKTPFIINQNNLVVVTIKGTSGPNKPLKNLTIKNKSLLESLNIERRNYIYVEKMPESNVIYYDSNLKKYRTISESIKQTNSSIIKKPLNDQIKQNLISTNKYQMNSQNRKLNQIFNYTKQTTSKTPNIDKIANQGRNTYSSNDRRNIDQNKANNTYQNQRINVNNKTSKGNENQYRRIYSYNNKAQQGKDYRMRTNVSENKNIRGNTNMNNRALINNNSQSRRIDSYNNKTQQGKDNRIRSNVSENKNIRGNTNINNRVLFENKNQGRRIDSHQGKDSRIRSNVSENETLKGNTNNRINTQANQAIKRGLDNQRQLISNKTQTQTNKNEINIKNPIIGKSIQEPIINKRRNEKENINLENINNPPVLLNKTLNSPSKDMPKLNKEEIDKNKQIQQNIEQNLGSIQSEFKKLQKLQSPYKNEEIIKDENGEIIQKKEEKTIILLPGQKIEPKSVMETFEKPVIEVVQNEDGTAQSIYKQTKIITAVENIPIENSSAKKGEDLQLIKQIITHEYKTVSATKDKLEMEEKKQNSEFNLEKNEINNEEEKGIKEGDMLKEKKDEIEKGEKEEKGEKGEKEEKEGKGEKEENDINKLRYMGIVGDEKMQKENLIKDNKNLEGDNKLGIKKEDKGKTGIYEDMKKNKDLAFKPKNKTNVREKKAILNDKKKEEITSKAKDIKSDLTGKQQISKKEKSKEKKQEKNNLVNDIQKGKTTNESTKQKSNLQKAQDKKENKDIKGKTKEEIPGKDLNANINNKTTNKEEVNLRKSFKRNKKEENDQKKSGTSGDIKTLFELYEKCLKLGNKPGSEKELERIVQILLAMEEKERKDILSKLLKTFPKSSDLNKKILNLINKALKNNDANKLKGKGKETDKDIQKESRSKSQIKERQKNKPKDEDDLINTDITKKIKFGEKAERNTLEHGDRLNNLYSANFAANTVNNMNIADLNFDGLFMDISKYQKKEEYKNPFVGPSSFYRFYKIRQSKIKKKLNDMTAEAKNNSQ